MEPVYFDCVKEMLIAEQHTIKAGSVMAAQS
jgi:hypothetical protein